MFFFKIKPEEGSLYIKVEKRNPMKVLKNGTNNFCSKMDDPERG